MALHFYWWMVHSCSPASAKLLSSCCLLHSQRITRVKNYCWPLGRESWPNPCSGRWALLCAASKMFKVFQWLAVIKLWFWDWVSKWAKVCFFSPLKLLTLYQEQGILLQGERWNPDKNERKFLKNKKKRKMEKESENQGKYIENKQTKHSNQLRTFEPSTVVWKHCRQALILFPGLHLLPELLSVYHISKFLS